MVHAGGHGIGHVPDGRAELLPNSLIIDCNYPPIVLLRDLMVTSSDDVLLLGCGCDIWGDSKISHVHNFLRKSSFLWTLEDNITRGDNTMFDRK